MSGELSTTLLRKVDEMSRAGDMVEMGNLCNPIHPLFRRESFPVSVDYDIFVPSLRLVTRLLETPQVQHHLFAAFFGENKRLPRDAAGRDFETYYNDRHVGAFTVGNIAAVKVRLLEMASMVRFDVKNITDTDEIDAECVQEADDANGYSCIANMPHIDGSPLPGSKTAIVIHKKWCELLQPAGGPERTSPPLVKHRFCLAVVMLHELAHAVNFALLGGRQEYFYEDCPIAEAGMCLEAALFGGLITGSQGATSHLIQWPNQVIVEAYKSIDIPIRNLERIPLKYQHWEIPDWFFSAFQQERFWVWAAQVGPVVFILPALIEVIQRSMLEGKVAPAPRAVVSLIARSRLVARGRPNSGISFEILRLRQPVVMREAELKAWRES